MWLPIISSLSSVAVVFLLFTPYTYLFLSFYSLFMVSLFMQSSFYSFWLSMELMTLLFMGISYTLFTNSVSQLMVYFLVQSLSSFLILTSYLTGNMFVMTGAFFMNLGMFPFMTWYLNVINRFPNFVFWLASTFHNIPPLLLLIHFNLVLNSALFWVSVLFSTLVAGVIMLTTFDFRLLLVASSVGNNSWFLFAEQVSYPLFLSFLVVYSVLLGFVIGSLGQLLNPSMFTSFSSDSYMLRWWFFVLCVSGLPPFPLFFLKMGVIFSLFTLNLISILFILFLVFNSFIVAGYINFMINSGIYRSSSVLHFSL